MKRLEAAGVIEGHGPDQSCRGGYPVSALIGITVPQPAKAKFLRLLETIPEVVECHHVTGADSYMMRLAAISMTHLEQLIERINLYGETRTSIVMSTPLPARAGATAVAARRRARLTHREARPIRFPQGIIAILVGGNRRPIVGWRPP